MRVLGFSILEVDWCYLFNFSLCQYYINVLDGYCSLLMKEIHMLHFRRVTDSIVYFIIVVFVDLTMYFKVWSGAAYDVSCLVAY